MQTASVEGQAGGDSAPCSFTPAAEPGPDPPRPTVASRAAASLPWYDYAEIEWATQTFWTAIAARLRALGLGEVPDQLRIDDEYEGVWREPSLLLSQCCGYDAVLPYRGVLRVVATPCYRAPGCVGSTYSSFVIVREDSPFRTLADLSGSRCVINNPTSHSGVNCLRALVAPLSHNGRFFSAVFATGSHTRSLQFIQDRQAEVAAIDCVVVALLRRLRPELLRGLRTLAVTPAAAAPPYVTRASLPAHGVRLLRQALADVVADPRLEDVRQALLIEGVEFLPLEAYEPMAELHQAASAQGYFEMEAALPR